LAASEKTVRAVMEVLMKHLSQEMIREILRDLQEVEGNASFKATIRALNRVVT
jgi:hypothetical protein